MKEQNYEQFKKDYNNIQPPEYLMKHGWEELSQRLPAQDLPKRAPAFQYGFIFAALLLCLTAGIVGASQTAKPGTVLYPVKTTSDELFKTLSNTTEKTVTTPAKLENPSVIKQVPPSSSPTLNVKPTSTTVPTKKLQTEFEIAPTIQQKPNIKIEENKSGSSNQQNSGSSNGRKVEGVATEKKEEKKENHGNGNGSNNGNNEQKSDNSGKGNKK